MAIVKASTTVERCLGKSLSPTKSSFKKARTLSEE